MALMDARVTLRVDGERRSLTVDTRVTLLDALRERLGVTSPKKGCDHGQCGACTVLVNGRRVLACLTLAVALDAAEVTTAAGLGTGPPSAAPTSRSPSICSSPPARWRPTFATCSRS